MAHDTLAWKGSHDPTPYWKGAVEPTAAVPGTGVLSGTLHGAAEALVVSGGRTSIITLTDDTWKAAGTGPIGSTADTQAIIDGVTAAQTETLGWNNEVRDKEVTGSVARTSATVCTITWTAAAAYEITAVEQITATIPAAAVTSAGEIVATGTTIIVALGKVLVTGTITDTVDEDDVVTGSKTLILTLEADNWKAAGTGPIGTIANTQAIIDGITSAQSEGTGWNAEVRDKELTANVVRTDAYICTITFQAAAAYDITAQETITVTVPNEATGLSHSGYVGATTFTVDEVATPTCAITGTAPSSFETSIVDGAKTIILTLTDDTWVAAGTGPVGSTETTQAIIDGLDASSSPTNGWNNEVRDKELVANVVRTSSTVVTITLQAAAAYSITAQEQITGTIPAAALTAAGEVVCDSTFFVFADLQAFVTGTVTDSVDEDDMVTGSKTLIITLEGTTWSAAGTGPIGSTEVTQEIIDGLDAAADPATGWNAEIRDKELTANVVRTSSAICTITFQAAAAYDIAANETITVTVPANAMAGTASPLTGDNTFDVATTDVAAAAAGNQRGSRGILVNLTGMKRR